MHMTENKNEMRTGFRIKWADREIEYFGESALDVFKEVFEHVKSVPITYAPAGQVSPQTTTSMSQITTFEKQKATPVKGDEYSRISKDANIPIEKVSKVIQFVKRNGFQEVIPFLPEHPDSRDAVRLVCYALQVGLQKTPIEVSYLKKILKGPNGYPLPSRELGLILKGFRRDRVIIASQTQKRNKPFTLSKKGIDQARTLLLKLVKK